MTPDTVIIPQMAIMNMCVSDTAAMNDRTNPTRASIKPTIVLSILVS